MDIIDIETRYGLIIESSVAEALRRAKIPFIEGFQYDSDSETPDFLVPNEIKPHYIIECHQTSDRESLKMKILRLLSAVFEAKVHFGKEIVSVNLLFGNIDILPPNNLDTFCCFYDVSFFPWKNTKYSSSIRAIETLARELATDSNYDASSAVLRIKERMSSEFDDLASYLKESLNSVSGPKMELNTIWEKETLRIKSINSYPQIGSSTEYKPTILQSLLLTDEDFEELINKKDPNECSKKVKKQLIKTGLVEIRDTVIKKYKDTGLLLLSNEFLSFINDPYSMSLRMLCKTQIAKDEKLGYFFEDIRDEKRRIEIAAKFIELVNLEKEKFGEAVFECLVSGSCFGIKHGRCWIADLMPLVVGESHNSFNRRMMANSNYNQHIGNPYSNIVIRSPRLGSSLKALKNYAEVATDCFFCAVKEKNVDLHSLDVAALAEKLFVFRKGGLIKLQKLNPLHIAIKSIAENMGLSAEYKGVKSIISDMSTGKFDMFVLSKSKKSVLVNALYIAPTYGSDHKADEWSARRRAIGYRLKNGNIVEAEAHDGYIFVVDGTWSEKSIRKLYRSGWNHICQLHKLQSKLVEIFKI